MKVLPGICSWLWACRGENLERRFWQQTWKIWKWRMHQTIILEDSTRKSYWSDKKDDEFIFPFADGTAKLSGRGYEFREPSQSREPTVRSEDLSGASRWIGRVSTFRTNRWRGSPCRLLVDPKWLHLSSSQWTSGSTLRVEGRNIPNSTEIHWCYKVYSHWSGCVTRESDWRLLECRFKQTFVRFVERIHKIHSAERENLQMNICVPVRDWQRSKRLPDQIVYVQKYGRKLVKPLRIEKNRNGQNKNRSLTMLKEREEFTSSIQMTKSTKKFSRMRKENWKDLWLQPYRASRKWLQSQKLYPRRVPKNV